jgi:hypothetical protein
MNLNLFEEWKIPSAAYRGKPFWSWNGELDADELIRQAKVFKSMGMGGYFMHSRTGLKTEYLGDTWFECINACADVGQALGMESWLYDEDRWPSGSAGGLATKETRFQMKYLRLRIFSAGNETIVWPDEAHFVAAFSAEVDDLELGNYEPIGDDAAVKPGRSLLIFSWEPMREHSFYNGQTYLDTMCAEATENFLQVTHDAYKKACGDRLGRSIKGIFTDEPHRGFVFCDRHGQPGNTDPGWITPWTPKLWDAFGEAFGYDLRTRLPELFLCPQEHKLSPVKWQYMELCQRLFLENWARPMQERCRQLGLILTGHVLHEDTLAAQSVPCGSMIRYYEYLDYPGVDILHLRNENFWVVKQLASAARQLGRPWLLSELYGCSGWQTDFEDHKRIGDWQALFGINLRCHHLSWYSMAGEAKRDFPASISFQSAWYQEYEVVETYFSRLHVLLQEGQPLCDVLVLNPVESLWAQIHVGWATWLSAVDSHVLELEEIYRWVFTWLCGAQIDFDYGDENFLLRMGSVAGDTLEVGQMRYKVVVVAGMETLRSSTYELLQRFRENGGQVIFAGDAPAYLDAVLSDQPRALRAHCTAVPLEEEPLVHAVRSSSGACGEVVVDENGRGLLCQIRMDGDLRIIVMLNPSETESCDPVGITARVKGPLTELDCLSGRVLTLETRQTADKLSWQTSFRPLQERVFVCGAAVPEAEAPAAVPALIPLELDQGFEYSLDEPNIAVLDRAEFSIDGGPWHSAQEILRVEEALCEALDVPLRGGQMVQPWAASGRAPKPGTPVRLRYSFEVAILPDAPVQLMIEQPGKVFLNGQQLEIPADSGWFIDPCFRTIELPDRALRLGHNEIILELDFASGSDLEAIYLLGSFGVATEEGAITLTGLPDRLGQGDWTQHGLPFYSGKIALKVPVGEASHLQVEPMGAATLCFRHPDGSARRILPWKPFVSDLEGLVDADGTVLVEWILTRRNTFGPHHLVPIQQRNIGPTSFRSSGEAWSDAHQLVPTGLSVLKVHLDDDSEARGEGHPSIP